MFAFSNVPNIEYLSKDFCLIPAVHADIRAMVRDIIQLNRLKFLPLCGIQTKALITNKEKSEYLFSDKFGEQLKN
jgi:hypothetical protein